MTAAGGTPEVSVVVTTHDRWPVVLDAVHCALDQQDVDVEVIVVDDGSSDATPALLPTLERDGLRVLRRDRAGGPSAARNLGLRAARGRWVAFLDDDDIWAPTKLRRQLDAAADQAAGLVFCSYVITDPERRTMALVPMAVPDDLLAALLRSNVVGSPSGVLADREAMLALGGFDERVRVIADWEMWLRLATRVQVAACPEPLLAYAEHAGGMHVDVSYDVAAEFRVAAERHRDLVAATGVRFGASDWPHWVAARHRSAGRRLATFRAYGAIARRERTAYSVGRALGILLGERAMRAGARALPRRTPPDPAWLPPQRERLAERRAAVLAELAARAHG